MNDDWGDWYDDTRGDRVSRIFRMDPSPSNLVRGVIANGWVREFLESFDTEFLEVLPMDYRKTFWAYDLELREQGTRIEDVAALAGLSGKGTDMLIANEVAARIRAGHWKPRSDVIREVLEESLTDHWEDPDGGSWFRNGAERRA